MLEQTASDGESETGEEGRWVELRILGTVEIWANGQSHHLGSAKQRLLFASLAHDVGRPVPADTLIDRLWDESPPAQARQNLHTYISRLRRRLRAAGGPGAPNVRMNSRTYALEADPDTIDLHRFVTLTAQARSLADAGDHGQALRLVTEAESLWRGEPLAGLPGLWAEQVRQSLQHRKVAVALIRANISLHRGHFADIVSDLSHLALQHPTDEALIEHLMIALYGRGLPTHALEEYRSLRRRLADETGAEPGPRLRRLQMAILRNTPVTDLLREFSHSATVRATTGPPPNNLPRRVIPIGRDEELEILRSAIGQHKDDAAEAVGLGAISGMAGVGKSTLAIHAAHAFRDHFPDGQLYINLVAHAVNQQPLTPAAALHHLLRDLGIPAEKIPTDVHQATTLWRTHLARRRVLIVLDDAADSEQVLPLLPGNSQCLVIVTSRRRLDGLPDQHHVSLDVLSEEDAIALFRRRVGEDSGSDASTIREIVRLCGYLPFAIEIIASRLNSHRSWSAGHLAYLLANSDQRLAEMHNSDGGITRIFEFSYRRLSGDQQTAFRRLGSHISAEFGAHAAAALAGMSLQKIERILEDLLTYHMLQEPTPHRYRIHDLLREYATDLSAGKEHDDDRPLPTDLLLDFYLCASDQADRILYGHRPRIEVEVTHAPPALPTWPDRAAVRQWFARESAALLAAAERAWEVGPPRRAALLANALGGFLDAEGHRATAETVHRRALEYWRSQHDRAAEARALIDVCLTCTRAGRYHDAIQTARRSAELARATGDDLTLAEALHRQAVPHGLIGQFHMSLPLQREALAIRRKSGDRYQESRCQNNLAITLVELGHHSEALHAFKAALSGFREEGDERTLALIHNNLGDLYQDLGDGDLARQSYERALNISAANGVLAERANILMNFAAHLQKCGELDEALALYREALLESYHSDDRRNQTIAHNGLGATLRLRRDHDEALAHHGRALSLSREIGATPEEFQALLGLGLTKYELGRRSAAIRDAQAALTVAQRLQVDAKVSKVRQILNSFEQSVSGGYNVMPDK